MSKTFQCSVNFGVAGQLNEESLFDALMGIKFDVTTSSSDWGHGESPVRHYLNCFLFVDTTKIPLIGKNNGTVVSLKRMKSLPSTRETLFNKPIIGRDAVVGVWEPREKADTEKLLLSLRRSLGYQWLVTTTKTASGELLDRIELAVGGALMLAHRASGLYNAAMATANDAVSKNLTAEDVREVARTRFASKAASEKVSELERAMSLWNRKLKNAQFIPEGISVTVVQVNPDEVKEDEIPGHYVASQPKVIVPPAPKTKKAKTSEKVSHVPAVMGSTFRTVRVPKNRSTEPVTISVNTNK